MQKKLLRDAARVHSYLKELPGGQLFTTKACKIQIPEHFLSRGLAEVGIDTYVYGIYALIFEDDVYAVSNINAMIPITPSKILTTKIDDVAYYEFYFEENSVIIPDLNLVRSNNLIYTVFDELIFHGKIPWYLNYEDMGHLFASAKKHADSGVAQSYETIELIASMLARDHNDRTRYYRTSVQSKKDLITPPDYVPLMSVFYSATNTLNKLAGNYFTNGLVSALVTPTKETERIETILRA